MAGPVLSDSPSILSNHNPSNHHYTSPSTSPTDYFTSQPILNQLPLSPLPLLSHCSYNSKPTSLTSNMVVDRPTLPGIASILAFAGHYPRGSSPSSPFSPSHSARPQSSDPIAHSLPALVAAPSRSHNNNKFSSPSCSVTPNLSPSTSHQQPTRRRRRRSSILVDKNIDNHSALIASRSNQHSNHSCQPHPILLDSPQNSAITLHSSPSNVSIPHHLTNQYTTTTNRPCNETRPFHEPDQIINHSKHSSNLRSSPGKHRANVIMGDDTLQQRHSDRNFGRRSRHTPTGLQHLSVANDDIRHPTCPASSTISPSSPNDTCRNQHTHTHPLHPIGRHRRRLSNASASSSSSVSGSTSLSSDFGASLNIGSQTRFNNNSTQPSSLSTSSHSINSTCKEHHLQNRFEPTNTCLPQDDSLGRVVRPEWKTVEDDRRIEAERRWEWRESIVNNVAVHHQRPDLSNNTTHQPEVTSRLQRDGLISSQTSQQHRYQCMEPGCGKTFSRPSSLKIHNYSHTGQKPFKCLRCDRAFSVQSNLKRHQKVHERRNGGGTIRPLGTLNSSGIGITRLSKKENGVAVEESDEEGSEGGMHDQMEE
ncbi:hypothetical protein O181_061269 [Austropuccinia psidii MF-1]|uniref:C2H2-type domain-containing protein n=1 Tax=Austropuccinia psidii MF-1 TaxID=1389203 RepID=A0A9Q3EI06_9BASI|nr:hypothetical protein [Austropuccinia psidii MF-1]